MDNNVIEKIQGLDSLTNLVWPDLLFNSIEVIEGLDGLVKLEDQSLFNRICETANTDTLYSLQLIYLRRFKRLHSLNLAGNLIYEDENYKISIAAYRSELVYLDFRLVDEIQELHQLTDMSLLETRVTQYNKEINELCDSLMMLELQLLDQLEVHSDEVRQNCKQISEINIHINYLWDDMENLDLPDCVESVLDRVDLFRTLILQDINPQMTLFGTHFPKQNIVGPRSI
ncbi:Leucine-rich repeat-containing protein 48 [Acipenser ruthenus]|uniref:Leucine-rich repeat-containing protein 48 n=1 Tax=Acipenser ruthenus TaxID=7906 RepID=A0A662Z050_ACIRT|nr:Leucine-rich repeat-containing protein 48 [Acipenser ruthenus]